MHEKIENYIPMEELKNGYIYKIKARNANYGVWLEKESAFMISRWKFTHNYLFLEIHWDKDDFVGTVKPIEIVEKFPFEMKEVNEYNGDETKIILSYLDSLDKDLKNVVHKSFGEIQEGKIM